MKPQNGKAAIKTAIAIGSLCLSQLAAQAVAINVDQILYQSSGISNPNLLSGTVDMTYAGNILTITLKNTSQNAAGSGSGVLLTGIGFYLPGTLNISSGLANMGASTAVGFSKPAGGDVSEEWGYDNGPIDSGALQGGQTPPAGVNAADTAVSSMESQTTAQFQAGSISQPPNLDGPDFGLVSNLETDGLGSGVEAIKDTLVITLTLSGSFGGNLLNTINNNWVVLTFGSPDSGGQRVPDGGTTALLLGGALLIVRLVSRRR